MRNPDSEAAKTVDKLIRILKREKERSGMSWEEIEKRAGVGKYTPRNWMESQSYPSIEKFIAVLKPLGLELCIRRIQDGKKAPVQSRRKTDA